MLSNYEFEELHLGGKKKKRLNKVRDVENSQIREKQLQCVRSTQTKKILMHSPRMIDPKMTRKLIKVFYF